MRALMKNAEDKTYFAMEISYVYYVPETSCLWIEGGGYDVGIRVSQVTANGIIEKLANLVVADLREFDSYIDDIPPAPHEEYSKSQAEPEEDLEEEPHKPLPWWRRIFG